MNRAEVKLPKRIADILNRKQAFIDAQRDKLEGTILRLQSELLSELIAEMVPEFDIVDSILQDTAKNYRLVSLLDKTFKDFNVNASQIVLKQLLTGTAGIVDLSVKYFNNFSDYLPKKLDKIVEAANKLINLRIGVDGGNIIRGGYLESLFNSNPLGVEMKNFTSKAITSGMDMKVYTRELRDMVTGSDGKSGGMERQFQRYAYDLYQQYDAAYNLMLGNEFGFKYFIYQGGLIKDSRDFCAAHNNKVWSIDEMSKWTEWTPSDGKYPEGYEVKQEDIYSVPSYISYPGYDPGIDRGGFNCRHSLGWIPDDMAFELRPDLKK